MYQHGKLLILSITVAVVLSSTLADAVQAQMKFYYDPATGNVAFDTTATRSGVATSYGIYVDPPAVGWELRWENQIRLSNSSIYTALPREVFEATHETPFEGLYTVGDILPVGLSEEVWSSFASSFTMPNSPLGYSYNDILGGGFPPDAELIYGKPEGEFVNRWDLVDPDTLPWASAVKLIYHDRSGEVIIDTTGPTGGYISAFHLESEGSFLPDGFTPFFAGPLQGASTDSVFGFADAIEPGQYNIGSILPAGLTAQQFEDAFTRAHFLGRAGFKGATVDFDADGQLMALHFVPEPNSIILLGLALVGAAGLLHRSVGNGNRSD